ncbi:MAG: tetratricopeptide repeat protein [Anaerolineae bacterium]
MSGRPRLCIYLLGPLRIERGEETVHLSRRKVESLLTYLILHPQEQRREQIATLLWGDSTDEQARASLRTALTVLKHEVGDDVVLVERETVQLNPDYPLWTDIQELERTAASAEPALNLYRGELLAEFYDDWIIPLRERYHDLYIDALLRHVETLRTTSRYEEAIELARQVLTHDSANERAFQHLIFCHMALGNRPAAIQAYEQCVRALEEELGVAPLRETAALYEWIKHKPGDERSLAARITNLPIPPTPFIGRGHEIATVKALIAPHARPVPHATGKKALASRRAPAAGAQPAHPVPPQPAGIEIRLVTLTGAGGSGKTRMAIQVGADLIDSFHDGVWWVELATLSDPALVPQAFAQALGIKDKPERTLAEALVDFLRPRQLLIIVDNCEHLIGACAAIAERLLTACPHIKLLTTSREALGIDGEFTYLIPTLSVPEPSASVADMLLAYESIRLFVERARTVRPEFALTEQNALAITHICQRLDGMPLAIELAAARINVLTPQEIAERLDDRFALLAHGSRTALPRQQTLRALIDWSYDLLTNQEQAFFARLAVFAGGRDLEAVEAVCSGEGIERGQALDLLARLVAKSLLVVREHAGETRYGMLDTIKAYALDKLHGSGEAERWKRRHLDYFLELVRTAQPQIHGPEQMPWLSRLEVEHNNLRLALRFALEHQIHTAALALADSLAPFWEMRGFLHEGREWLKRALDAAPAPAADSPPEYRRCYAWAMDRAAELAIHQSDYSAARALATTSLELFRALGDRPGWATALNTLGAVVRLMGEYDVAEGLHHESLNISRELGDRRQIVVALNSLGTAAQYQDRIEDALSYFQEALDLERESDNRHGIAIALTNVGTVVQQKGDFTQARALHAESLAILRELHDRWAIAGTLSNLGLLAEALRDYTAARAYYEEGLEIARELGERRGMAILTRSLGMVSMAQGDLEAARRLHEESLAIRRGLGHKRGVCLSLANLALVVHLQGDADRARELYTQSLTLCRDLDDQRTMIDVLVGLARIHFKAGAVERAAQLTAFVDARLAALPLGLDAAERDLHAQTLAQARAQLAPAVWDAAWQAGQRMGLDEAVHLATRWDSAVRS